MFQEVVKEERIAGESSREQSMIVVAPDGTRVPVRYWEGQSGRGAIVFVHGLLSHSGWFVATGGRFSEIGYTCAAFDRRGSGRSESARGHMWRYSEIVDEIGVVIDWLRERHPGIAIHLAGQCYGALPVLAYAVGHAERLASLMLISPGIRVHTTLSLPRKLLAALTARVVPQYRLPVPLTPEHFTDLPDRLEWIRADTLRLREATSSFYLQTLLLMRRVKRGAAAIRTPAFVALAGSDGVCDNGAARSFFERLGTSDKRLEIYERSKHSLEHSLDRALFLEHWLQWIAAHEIQVLD